MSFTEQYPKAVNDLLKVISFMLQMEN